MIVIIDIVHCKYYLSTRPISQSEHSCVHLKHHVLNHNRCMRALNPTIYTLDYRLCMYLYGVSIMCIVPCLSLELFNLRIDWYLMILIKGLFEGKSVVKPAYNYILYKMKLIFNATVFVFLFQFVTCFHALREKYRGTVVLLDTILSFQFHSFI